MGFTLPQLNSSCCGCTLRTGSLVILWIFIVLNALFLVGVPLAQQGTTTTNSTNPAGPTSTTPAPNTKSSQIAPLTIGDVITSIINVVVSCIALYGVYKDLHVYLVPFLVWEAIFTVQQVVRGVIYSFTIGTILAELLFFAVLFYFWLVVYSHYRALKGSSRPITA